MSPAEIVMVGAFLAGLALGAFFHSIITARREMHRAAALDAREVELEMVAIHMVARPAPRRGTSDVKPRGWNADTDTQEPAPNVHEVTPEIHRRKLRNWGTGAYSMIVTAARALSEPVTVISVPGRPQDTRELADALAATPGATRPRHAAPDDEWETP